jgi:DNA-binding Xre family transcriptional regulator
MWGIDRAKVKSQMKREKIQTFAELADQIGVRRQAPSKWFSGGPFHSDNLAALCKALRCTPNDVLAWDWETVAAGQRQGQAGHRWPMSDE